MTDPAANPTAESAPAERTPKGRSPSYPGVPLKTAVQRVHQVYNVIRSHEVSADTMAKHLGYKSPSSGPATVMLAALKKFGLVEDSGRGDKRAAKLSDLAVEIVVNPNPLPHIQRAALTPEIHREMWQQYKCDVPPDDALRYELVVKRGFTESGWREFAKEYRETIAFAQLSDDVTVDLGELEEDDALNPPPPDPRREQRERWDREDQLRNNRVRQRDKEGGVMAYSLPLAPGSTVTLEGTFPLTETEWAQMMRVLEVLKPGLVVESPVPDLPRSEINPDEIQ